MTDDNAYLQSIPGPAPTDGETANPYLDSIPDADPQAQAAQTNIYAAQNTNPDTYDHPDGVGMFGGGHTSRHAPDEMTREAWEHGYFPEFGDQRPEINDLYNALSEELRGNPRRSDALRERDEAKSTRAQARNDLTKMLSDIGLDLKTGAGTNNGYVREVLARHAAQAEDGGGRELAQAKVATPPWLHSWLGIDDKPIQANYDGLLRKYLKKAKDEPADARFKSENDIKDHVEHVLENPDIAIPGNNKGSFLLVRTGDPNKSIVLEIKGGKQQHQIISVMPMTDYQLNHKIENARRRGGTPDVLVKPPSAEAMVVQHRHLPPPHDGLQPSAEITLHPANVDGKPHNQAHGQDKRGSITFPEGGLGSGPTTIRLFQAKNASTMFHETAHLWLEELVHWASDPEYGHVFKGDLDTVMNWFGVDDPAKIADQHHEQFARGFEQFIMEGKAPTPQLADVFSRHPRPPRRPVCRRQAQSCQSDHRTDQRHTPCLLRRGVRRHGWCIFSARPLAPIRGHQ